MVFPTMESFHTMREVATYLYGVYTGHPKDMAPLFTVSRRSVAGGVTSGGWPSYYDIWTMPSIASDTRYANVWIYQKGKKGKYTRTNRSTGNTKKMKTLADWESEE